MPTQLDQQAVALSKAIREGEGFKGDWNMKGQSGEWGAYQFTPDTWNAYSKEAGVNSPFGAAAPDEQNKVAYYKIKQWKDQGYNPGQIASMWNAGPGRPDAYREEHKGTNSMGVRYDTPEYAKRVAMAYQRLKGEQFPAQQGESDQTSGQQEHKTFLQDVGSHIGQAGTGLATAIGRATSGEINPASGLIQGVGALAGGLNNVVNDTLQHAPIVGGLVRGAENLLGKGVKGLAGTNLGQKAISTYQGFEQSHPELAEDIKSGVDIATALPVLKGIGAAKGVISGGLDTALRGSSDAVLETVGKDLTPNRMAEAIATRGVEKKGILREVKIKPNPREIEIADAVRGNVPKFDPSKPLLTNIGKTQKVVNDMKETLKKAVQESGADRIYSYRELESKLKNIEMPDLVASDTTLRNLYKRVIKRAMDIAKSKEGKVSNLLDVRQEFDSIMAKQFPNLYSSDTLTPIRQVVRDVREALNDFTAKNLPDGEGFRDSLLTQHKLIRAIENMSEKASKGSTKEVGTNMVTRFGNKHPIVKGLIKAGTRAAVEGTGIGAAMRILD